MSAAKKIAASAPSEHCARVDAARAHHGKCCKALTDAEAGVAAARGALERAPRDPRERAVAREALVMAEEDLAAARAGKCAAEDGLKAAERARDVADATAFGERVSRAAQRAEVDALVDLFERLVVDSMRTWLTAVADRRVSVMADARALQAIWRRLGHDFRVSGVDVELGTGTADIPPTVSVDQLTSLEMSVRSRLQERLRGRALAKDHLGIAALQLLLPALAPENRQYHSGGALHELVWDRVIAGGRVP